MDHPMYDPKKLEEAIKKKEENIKVFEQAIADERAEIEKYREMIKVINEKAKQAEIAKAVEESQQIQ